jgi:hypothetical protein
MIRRPLGSSRCLRGLIVLRIALCAALIVIGLPAAWADEQSSRQIPWDSIRQVAEQFVAKESPADAWPFKAADTPSLAAATKKVFADYFDPIQLSADNLPAQRDYYATQLLPRQGVEGKFSRQGGYLRGRPLPIGPWDSPYWQQINYAIDILRARAIGLDGFQFDMLQANTGRYWDDLLMMCDVATAIAPGFSILPEPDMAALQSISVEDLTRALTSLAQRSAMYRLSDGRMLVTPFYPESSPAGYWSDVVDEMARRNAPIALIPVLLNFGLHASSFAHFSYGLSYWGDRDPVTFADDNFFGRVRALRSGRLATMLPIAPQDVRPKNSMMWEAANTRLFRAEWSKAIAEAPDFVHLITWNDYSESTEISPSNGTQYIFYDLTRFYTHWFKTGQMPSIVKDAIFYTHRRQIERLGEPPISTDLPMKLNGAEALHNDIEMIAFLTSPAQLEIEIDGQHYTADAQAGLAELRAPAAVGRPRFRILRNGVAVVEKLSDWPIEGHPNVEDPSYVGGSSSRAFIELPQGQ